MAYIDQFTLSQDITFRNRVKIAMVKAANTVVGQTTPDGGQLAAARKILDAPDTFVVSAAYLVVLDATVAASAPTGTGLSDAQLQTAVNASLLALVR